MQFSGLKGGDKDLDAKHGTAIGYRMISAIFQGTAFNGDCFTPL